MKTTPTAIAAAAPEIVSFDAERDPDRKTSNQEGAHGGRGSSGRAPSREMAVRSLAESPPPPPSAPTRYRSPRR